MKWIISAQWVPNLIRASVPGCDSRFSNRMRSTKAVFGWVATHKLIQAVDCAFQAPQTANLAVDSGFLLWGLCRCMCMYLGLISGTRSGNVILSVEDPKILLSGGIEERPSLMEYHPSILVDRALWSEPPAQLARHETGWSISSRACNLASHAPYL